MQHAAMSKYVTVAYCIYCHWSQDLGKIFKRKHRIKEPAQTCGRCHSRCEQTLGRYLYEEVHLLLKMIPFVRVRGFVPAEAETQPKA